MYIESVFISFSIIYTIERVLKMPFRKSMAEIEQERKLKLIEQRKVPLRRGKVYVIKERCKGCGFCIENCPSGVLVRSEDVNEKGYHYPVVVEDPPFKVCIACGFCSLICPEFAIYSVLVEPEEENDGRD